MPLQSLTPAWDGVKGVLPPANEDYWKGSIVGAVSVLPAGWAVSEIGDLGTGTVWETVSSAWVLCPEPAAAGASAVFSRSSEAAAVSAVSLAAVVSREASVPRSAAVSCSADPELSPEVLLPEVPAAEERVSPVSSSWPGT